MTEIPEHLLARSKARRQAIGQDEGDAASGDAPATGAAVEKAAPAAAAASGPAVPAGMAPGKAPAAAAPPPEKPKRPEVVAAESRKKIPGWAVPALLGLPVWAFLYAFTLDPPTVGLSPALSEGQALFSTSGAGCAGCHGPNGEGGVGPAMADGAVIETFPDYQDHVKWVTLGSTGWADEVGQTYGAQDKPVGGGGMPAFGNSLSEDQVLLVVRYEREVVSGYGCEPELAEATGEECAPGTEAQGAAPAGG
jgi:mono/diheme cytochrome c family protein